MMFMVFFLSNTFILPCEISGAVLCLLSAREHGIGRPRAERCFEEAGWQAEGSLGICCFQFFQALVRKEKSQLSKHWEYFFGGEKPSKMGFIIYREYNHKNWGFNYQRYD
jgi:hypothetical protein